MSLRIPVKAGDFPSFSRRTPVHPVNFRPMSLAGATVILKPSDVLGRLALLLAVRLSWVPRLPSFLPFCLTSGHDRFLPLSV